MEELRNEIVDFLLNTKLFENADNCNTIFIRSKLDFMPKITFSNPESYITQLYNQLVHYGENQNGQHTLICLLNCIKERVGKDKAIQVEHFIKRFKIEQLNQVVLDINDFIGFDLRKEMKDAMEICEHMKKDNISHIFLRIKDKFVDGSYIRKIIEDYISKRFAKEFKQLIYKEPINIVKHIDTYTKQRQLDKIKNTVLKLKKDTIVTFTYSDSLNRNAINTYLKEIYFTFTGITINKLIVINHVICNNIKKPDNFSLICIKNKLNKEKMNEDLNQWLEFKCKNIQSSIINEYKERLEDADGNFIQSCIIIFELFDELKKRR